MKYRIRPLKTLEDCQRVVELEKQVWGYSDGEDVVPSAILLVSAKRGGILLGAFDPADDRMVGFVYSLAALKDGRPTQWSHMLGVLAEARDSGLGAELKKAQRRAALESGVTTIEWTFDPMQALNAHLNFAKLGTIAEEYAENVYGESSSPLHRGTPTDRLIALWQLDAPHVVRRIEGKGLPLREPGTFDAPTVLRVMQDLTPSITADVIGGRRVAVEIPTGFSEMQASEPALALRWRMATRSVFTTCFARGYRAVDFFLERDQRRGRYLLAIP
jgi:predicted GNAT superfamily acetyltransferase